MGRTLWWIASAAMLVIFLPVGIILLAVTILKEIGYMFEATNVVEDIPEIEEYKYFENTLEKFR